MMAMGNGERADSKLAVNEKPLNFRFVHPGSIGTTASIFHGMIQLLMLLAEARQSTRILSSFDSISY